MKTLMDSEIQEVERFHGVQLPRAFVAFLRGEDGILENLVWEDPGAADPNLRCDCDTLKRLRRAAENMLTDEQIPFTLAPDDFVFHFRGGPLFLFFRCDPDHDDPAVFCCRMDAGAPKEVFPHFSDWAASLLAKPDERAVISSGEPPAITPHLDLAPLVTPEMEAELRRVTERFPPELRQIESHLGWPVGACRTATANLAAGVVLGVLLLGLAVAVLGWVIYQAASVRFALPLAASREMSWLGGGLAVLLSVGLGVVAGLLIARARRLARSSLVVAAHGFSWVRLGHVEMVAWSELKEFRETALPEPGPTLALLGWLFGKREEIQCEAFTTDGRRFSFGSSMIQQAKPLRAIFRRVAAELEIP